jgi:hypothetical protein
MKTGKLLVGLTLMVLAGCAMSLGVEELVSKSRNAIEGGNLTLSVPEPVTGAYPVFSFSAAPSYIGSVSWMKGKTPLTKDDFFEADTAYSATVRLEAFPGYDFAGVPAATAAGSFTHDMGTVSHAPGSGGTLTIRIDFDKTDPAGYVGDYNLQNYVPVPVARAVPVKSLIRPDLTVTAQWKDDKGTTLDEGFAVFDEGMRYEAKITLTAKTDYRFNTDNPFEYPPGAVEEVVTVSPDPRDTKERTLSVLYKPTERAKLVKDGDLTSLIPAPVAGGTAAWSFATEGYTGAVAWKMVGSETDTGTAMLTSQFQPETLYRADVTLTADSGYTLEGVQFTHSKGDLRQTGEGQDGSPVTKLEILFLKTAKQAIDDLDLTLKLPKPARGGTPSWYFSAPQYTGAVRWEPELPEGLFGAEENYTAEITLTVAPGYSFAEVGENAFVHNGADKDPALVPNPKAEDNGDGRVTVTIVFGSTGTVLPSPVSELDLAPYIPKPEKGGTPVRYFYAPQYSGTVEWKSGSEDLSGLFQGGAAYTAAVTLIPASGYTFAGVGKDRFSYATGAASITNAADSGIVTIVFPSTKDASAVKVSDLDLAPYIPKPERGETPVRQFTALQYSGTVKWKFGEGEELSGPFQWGTVYTATVKLTPASGYTFAGVEAGGFKYTAAGADLITNAADTGAVTITFARTAFAPTEGVSDLDLARYISKPERGGMPGLYFSAPQYLGSVSWTETNDGAPHDDFAPFAGGVGYTATVELTAVSGYTFAGVGEHSFRYSAGGTKSIVYAADSGTVTIVFVETTNASDTVTDRDLTTKVPQPASGDLPLAAVAGLQYSGSVSWTETEGGASHDNSVPFAEGVKYTATVDLTAASDYTFAGIAASPPASPYFTYTRTGVTVTHSAGSETTLQVNVAFPPTVAATRVSLLDLAPYLLEPEREESAAGSLASGEYTGLVTWKKYDSALSDWVDKPSGRFEKETVYQAVVDLTALSGYTFAGIVAPPNFPCFTHTGTRVTAVTHSEGSGPALRVYVTFQKTLGDIRVRDLDLTQKVPRPASGGHPPTYFSWIQYMGTGTWRQYNGSTSTWDTMVDSTFQTGTAYKAVFDLTAASGWTFDGIAGNTFIHTGTGVTVTHGDGVADTLTVTLEFLVVVDIFNLTSYLPAPVRGVNSTGLTSTSQYTGKVVWTWTKYKEDGQIESSGTLTTGDPFAADTEYKAELLLEANPGYVFGVGANAFTHSGAAAGYPSNAEGSGDQLAITVVFPKTAKAAGVEVEW